MYLRQFRGGILPFRSVHRASFRLQRRERVTPQRVQRRRRTERAGVGVDVNRGHLKRRAAGLFQLPPRPLSVEWPARRRLDGIPGDIDVVDAV